jgi:hypothetical protein
MTLTANELHQWAARSALLLCEQVVIPFPIGMRAQVRQLETAFTYDTHIDLATRGLIGGIKGFLLTLDSLNRGLARYFPIARGVPDVRDVLMLAQTIGFCDACDLVLFHG